LGIKAAPKELANTEGQQVKKSHPAKKPKSESEFEHLVARVLKEMNIEDESTTTPISSQPRGKAGKAS